MFPYVIVSHETLREVDEKAQATMYMATEVAR